MVRLSALEAVLGIYSCLSSGNIMGKIATVRRGRRPKQRTQEARALSADQYSSKTLSRALDVLECFPDEHTALGLKELSSRTVLPQPSLFRILITLESRGYLLQGQDGTYRISPRLLYGKVRENTERLRNAARPHLEALAAQFNETASLSCLLEDRIQVVDTVETFHAMRSTNRPGRILPPHCSAMGKSITAFQTPEKINRLLEVYGLIQRTPKTITDRLALSTEFAQLRERGYAIDSEEASEGSFCIGAPVRCEGKPVVAAVSLSMPCIRFDPGLEESIVAAVVATTNSIASAIS